MTDRTPQDPWFQPDQSEVYLDFCLSLTPEQRLQMLDDLNRFLAEARAAMERKRGAERALAPSRLKQDQ
ncbi:MAG: hypothetical protein A3D95_05435 [Betaproteobacteria bacterium RIFCSPHIGHO2_12_FULL_69_13]|nr:MAG: hypothetical protein A3D95_05435 [Betaproteobacteria bacterium RIFCSPHIGHO2_12_FULL_69_13]OGA66005.1 MAG: hypothetical protein A3G83_04305 [Betaproteobacteria bacterium RIFCSPLOWO2_12_FULL_68_20]